MADPARPENNPARPEHQPTRPDGGAVPPDGLAVPPDGTAAPDGGAVPVAGLAGAAGRIAALTTASRIVGFARIFVFSALIGLDTTLANTYQSVNTLPNIVFEIVAGGALAMVVVPLLSSALASGDGEGVSRTSSALLTWTIVVLTPLALLVAVCARPIVVGLLHGAHPDAHQLAVGTRMLYVFAPQLVLYGVGIVLTGVLQAHRRFAGPALAPLLSSVTVMAAYGLFALLAGRRPGLEQLSLGQELVLSAGTTAAVAVLALSLLVPLRGTGVRLWPTLRFPPGVARRLRGLVGGGLAAVVAQQLATLVVLVLCQPIQGAAAYLLAQTLFLLPWAVFAVPVATSAFPRLATAHAAGDEPAFRAVLAASVRTIVLLSAVGAAGLIAVAAPAADLLVAIARGRDAAQLAGAIAAFGPGLIGYGLFALLSRALYAVGAARTAALATVAGWSVVIAADVVLAAAVSREHLLAGLAAGSSIGLTVLGGALLFLLRRRVGAVPGFGRAGAAALAVLVVGSAAGLGAGRLLGFGPGIAGSLAQGMLVGVVVLVVSGVIGVAAYPRSARSVLTRARGTVRD